jgi:hypothetical protein
MNPPNDATERKYSAPCSRNFRSCAELSKGKSITIMARNLILKFSAITCKLERVHSRLFSLSSKYFLRFSQITQMQKGTDKRTLYIGGLDENVTQDIITAAFISFGDITDVQMSFDASSGAHRGFCFITYESPGEYTR